MLINIGYMGIRIQTCCIGFDILADMIQLQRGIGMRCKRILGGAVLVMIEQADGDITVILQIDIAVNLHWIRHKGIQRNTFKMHVFPYCRNDIGTEADHIILMYQNLTILTQLLQHIMQLFAQHRGKALQNTVFHIIPAVFSTQKLIEGQQRGDDKKVLLHIDAQSDFLPVFIRKLQIDALRGIIAVKLIKIIHRF